MIRVLHTIDTTGPGGAETVFVNLIRGLDAEMFESVVVISGPGWICDTLRQDGIEPHFVESRGKFNLNYLRELFRIVKEKKIDIIQSHLLGANLYCSMVGLLCKVPVFCTIHGFVDVKNNERLMWLKSVLINLGSKKIIFVSNRLRQHYVEHLGFSSRKSITSYNGVDTSVFYPKKDVSIREKLGIGAENIVLGAVGNIRPAKGYDIFLKAARLVYDQHPECRFVVAGEGSGKLYDELLKMRTELDLDKVFFFTGFRSDAAKVLNNMDIFVLPSLSEGFSISTIEAMACGLPVIVTKSGGPEEIIEDLSDGLMVEPGNVEALANGIVELIHAKVLQDRFSENALKKVLNSFSLKSSVAAYIASYKSEVTE